MEKFGLDLTTEGGLAYHSRRTELDKTFVLTVSDR